jgi:hypothetical protein
MILLCIHPDLQVHILDMSTDDKDFSNECVVMAVIFHKSVLSPLLSQVIFVTCLNSVHVMQFLFRVVTNMKEHTTIYTFF